MHVDREFVKRMVPNVNFVHHARLVIGGCHGEALYNLR